MDVAVRRQMIRREIIAFAIFALPSQIPRQHIGSLQRQYILVVTKYGINGQ